MPSEIVKKEEYDHEFFFERDSDINHILSQYFHQDDESSLIIKIIKQQIHDDRIEITEKNYGKSYLNIIGKPSVIQYHGKTYKITTYI